MVSPKLMGSIGTEEVDGSLREVLLPFPRDTRITHRIEFRSVHNFTQNRVQLTHPSGNYIFALQQRRSQFHGEDLFPELR
jgi:hypothetical protein